MSFNASGSGFAAYRTVVSWFLMAVLSWSSARGQQQDIAASRDFTRHHPDDPKGWIALGRVLLAHASANDRRLEAIRAFRTALTLGHDSTDALAGLAGAGLQLGGADGEAVASEALQRLLGIAPMYQGAWESWLSIYRGHSERGRMRSILSAHDTIPQVRYRIAQLLLEDERYPQADSMLEGLLAIDSTRTCWLSLRAQSAYEQGDSVAGWSFYQRALSHASSDSDCLWDQVSAIANIGEARAWSGARPSARTHLLEEFWARRNPDLFQSTNGRILEHFRRLRIARRRYPLLHPLSMYHRTKAGLSQEASPSIAEQIFYQRCEVRPYPNAPVSARDRVRTPLPDIAPSPAEVNGLEKGLDQVQPPGTLYLDPEFVHLVSIPQSEDLRDLDTSVARATPGGLAGLDDRGITFLRYGQPAGIAVGADNVEDPFCQIPRDLERWTYLGVGTIRFFRPNAVFVGLQGGVRSTGDLVFRPMASGQFEATSEVLSSDRSSVSAPLAFGFWVAQFRDHDSVTSVVITSTRGRAAVSLVSTDTGGARDSNANDGAVALNALPGNYDLLVNALENDSLGRQRTGLRVRRFAGESMSDIVLAVPWGDTAVNRQAMLDHISRRLAFADGRLRAYAELYGLLADTDGLVRYRVAYQISATHRPTRDARQDSLESQSTLAFDRAQRRAPSGQLREWHDFDVSTLAPGRYLLRLEARDSEGRRVGRSQVEFTVTPNRN